nr:retrovirus-related Pol polyprotein from transposon TNT 1-94 [Tanacetum cinerariifolium]
MVKRTKLDEDLQGIPVDPTRYHDVDRDGCQDTRRSTSSSAQFLGDRLVRWSSKKQKITGENVEFAELVREDSKFQTSSRKPNNHISKRLQSYQHVIKIDATLGNLKFTNKGAKDLVFGMSIPTVMLNDDIKASADYSKYLVKSKGGKSKGRGKGLTDSGNYEGSSGNFGTRNKQSNKPGNGNQSTF